MHRFSGLLGLKWGFWRQNRESGDAIVTPNEIIFYFFLRLCEFWWKSIKKCDDESAHRWIHRLTDANRFYNLSHALCYSYGTDNNKQTDRQLLTGYTTGSISWDKTHLLTWSLWHDWASEHTDQVSHSYHRLLDVIIIILLTMFMVLSSWHSHCESSPGSFDECRLSAGWPTLRPNWPIWAVSPPKDWLLPSADTM